MYEQVQDSEASAHKPDEELSTSTTAGVAAQISALSKLPADTRRGGMKYVTAASESIVM
jgi:hypothetical protein